MGYIIAALFGLSLGVLIATSRGWLPTVSTLVLVAIGVGYATWGPGSSPYFGFTIAGTGIIATILAGGVVSKDHPLLEGTGYWYRVWAVFRHSRMLRR